MHDTNVTSESLDEWRCTPSKERHDAPNTPAVVERGLVGTLGLFAVQGVPAQEATPAAEVAPLTLESLRQRSIA